MPSSTQNSADTGDLTIPNSLTVSGDFPFIMGLTGNTSVIFPESGTLATVDGGGGISWTVATVSQTLVANTGIFCKNVGLTFTLPTTFKVGDTFYVVNCVGADWTIAQNSSQTIFYGENQTTTGASGGLESTQDGCVVMLVCDVANTSLWVVGGIANVNGS